MNQHTPVMTLPSIRTDLESIGLPEGWSRCGAAEEIALAAQLQRELRPGHALYGHECTALARRGACDAVLYFASGERPTLAVVHLTWHVPRGRGEFPWTEHFASVGDWTRSRPRE